MPGREASLQQTALYVTPVAWLALFIVSLLKFAISYVLASFPVVRIARADDQVPAYNSTCHGLQYVESRGILASSLRALFM